jgi:hypothetical protein
MLIGMARLAAQGRIQFWHPWHMERTAAPGRIGRTIVWSAAPNGDREWPHALARCSHLVDLAAGHALTGSPELLGAWIDHVSQLARSRARGLRSGWAGFLRPYERELWGNRLDGALRLVNLIRSYDLVRECPTLTPTLHALVLGLVMEEAERLNEELGRRAGNWEVFIGSAVVLASVFLNRIDEARGWGQRANARLDEILRREIGPDGVMTEQVPMYQGVCALALADLIVAFGPNDLTPPPSVVHAVRTMIGALERIADPEGRIPQIGDSDAFEIDYLERFASAALKITVAGRVKIDRTPTAGIARVDALPSVGWAVARWRDGESGTGYLLFDASGRPPATHAGHSHADDLQVLVHLGDGPLFVDPGRFTYANGFQPHLPLVGRALTPRGRFDALGRLLFPRFRELNERDWREYFRSTLEHNTVSIGGRNQPGYDGDGGEPASVRLITAEANEGGFSFSGSSAGVGAGPKNFRHQRFVIAAVPALLAVIDHLEADAEADWIASFHAGIGVGARALGADTVELQRLGGTRRKLAFACTGAGRLEVTIDDDWVSPVYNEKKPSRTVRATIRRGSSVWLVSALTLRESSSGATITIHRDGAVEGSAVRVSVSSPDGEVEACLDSASGSITEVRRRSRY